uniref:hypothetical protein n=1 Tax=Gillisia sp. CAL575 TaxID=985255 RepID=UPI001E2D2A25
CKIEINQRLPNNIIKLLGKLKLKRLSILLISLLALNSCKEDKSKSLLQEKPSDSKQDNREINTFTFPDTVFINTMVKGVIEYNRNFGNTNDSKIKERYIFFHVGTDQNYENLEIEEFDRFPNRLAFEDTIGNGLIQFETVFTKSGLNYLHGVVKDIYIIETSQIEDSI